MDLVNRKVLHKTYGEGEIKKVNNKFNETIIEIDFEKEKGKRFKYPDIFKGDILVPLDFDLKQEIDNTINEEIKVQEKQNVELSNKVIEKNYKNDNIMDVKNVKDYIKNVKDGDELKYFIKLLASEYCKNSAMISNLNMIKQNSIAEKIINTKVKHNDLGEGVIQRIIEGNELKVDVKFNSGIIKQFNYPEAFEREFIVLDNTISSIIKNEIIIYKEIKEQNIINREYEDLLKEKEGKYESIDDAESEELSKIKVFDNEDFVLKSNDICCEKRGHVIENITAIIPILTDNEEIIYKKIISGYCKDCNIYFILDAIYEKIKKFGVPYCKIDDVKHYYGGGDYNGELAEQSILKIYGYSVGENEGLTSARRHNILATIVDNQVLSVSRIINYLNYFIRQRETSNKDYSVAISKWREDIEFLESYQIDKYRHVIAKSIKRRW